MTKETALNVARAPRRIAAALAAAGLAFASLAPAAAQPGDVRLSEASAAAIVAGCRAHADENGYDLTIAVYDEGGNLKALTRMDGATLRNLRIAQWKGESAARGQRYSGPTAEAVAEGRINAAFAPDTVTYRGAVPIFSHAGAPLGGVGVSGATGEQDEQCAEAGIAAADLLTAKPE